jgi:hypothetical protein
MVLILFSVVLAATAVAISMIHSSFGSLSDSGIAKESIVREDAEQKAIAGQARQFLVVVLPDGKVVTPRVAERV